MTQGRRTLAPATPVLPNPPAEYDQIYMSRLISAIQSAMQVLENPATARGGWLNLSAPRFDCFNLTVGDIWVDGNTLKITRIGDFGFIGNGVSMGIGFVTVTT